MIKDCLEVFYNILYEKGDSFILDQHIPANGRYVIVDMSKLGPEVIYNEDIRYDKKTKEIEGRLNINYPYIQIFDYNSQLISMNKPMDPKKIIHSNNYLSFFIKKDNLNSGKLTTKVIEDFYDLLGNPGKKYSKSKAKQIYENVETEIGKVDFQKVSKVKEFILSNIFNIEQLNIPISGKEYLKIFFIFDNLEEVKKEFEQEGKRYFIPNVFNSNDYNMTVNDKILGVPNNNLGLNAKKIYLEHKTREIPLPHLATIEEVLLQKKLFDYLMILANRGKFHVYFDIDNNKIYSYENGELPSKNLTGIYLRIQKGKEVEVLNMDTVSQYRNNLIPGFEYKDFLGLDFDKMRGEIPPYGEIGTLREMQQAIHKVCFSNFLIQNYNVKPEEISVDNGVLERSILLARDALISWFYMGNDTGSRQILCKVTYDLIIGALKNDYIQKAQHLFNIYISLNKYFKKGDYEMKYSIAELQGRLRNKINSNQTRDFEDKEEYFFGVGQLLYYFISLSRSGKKNHSLINPFLNIKNNDLLKEKLTKIFIKYNYTINAGNKRSNNLHSMVLAFDADEEINKEIILAGYLSNNLIYEKEENNV